MTTGASSTRRVLLFHNDPTEIARLSSTLEHGGFSVTSCEVGGLAIDELFHHPPSLILAAEGAGGRSVATLARDLKADPLLGRLPLVAFIRDICVNDIDWTALGVDDYITIPYSLPEVVQRLRLCLSRMARSLDANPLTHLPGNTTILFETTRRIESRKPFALAYLDIDNFKSFNDRYGYARGDEVLDAACRLLTTVVSELAGPDGFVGHVGGDDFVFMSSPDTIETLCKTMIKRFDLVIPDFYDQEDRLRGSIAVVTNEHRAITHPGDVSKIASELKKAAKAMQGVCMSKTSAALTMLRALASSIRPAKTYAGVRRTLIRSNSSAAAVSR